MIRYSIWLSLAGVALSVPSSAWGELAVTEEVLGPAHNRRGLPTASADGLHYAYVTTDPETYLPFVVHDGVEGPRLRVVGDPLTFSADGTRFAYAGMLPDGGWCCVIDGKVFGPYERVATVSLGFSADGKRVIYAARAEGKSRVYVDGQPGPPYDRIHAPVVFSPDGGRYLYKAKRGDKWVLVVDGKETGEYDDTQKDHPVFSPDSKRVACHACTGPWEGGEHFVVVDGVRGPSYDAIAGLTFSPDGSRVAYIARRGEQRRAVIDGQEGPGFDSMAGLRFSPDGKRVAYKAKRGEKWLTVVDGEARGGEYDGVSQGSPLFSPDGAHVVVHACRGPWEGGKHFFVADGEEGPEYDFVSSWRYSPDGKRFTYEGRRGPKEGGKRHLILDGVEGPAYDDVWSAVFSPDSRRFGYVAGTGEKDVIMVDGVEQASHDEAGLLSFSPDSNRLVYEATRGPWKGGKHFIVVDGEPGPECDMIVKNGPTFIADDAVQYLAIREGNLVRITQRIVER